MKKSQKIKSYFELIIAPIIVGVFLMGSTMIINNSFQKFIKPKKEIIMGFTAHPAFEIDQHESLLNNKITDPLNDLLGSLGDKYEFTISIRGENSYDEIFESLYLNRIDIGFFSPYAYIDRYLHKDYRLDKFEYIGQKYMPYGKYYYSGILVPRNWVKNIGYSSYTNLKKNNISLIDTLNNHKTKYYVNIKENSTSTRIIPEIIIHREEFKLDFDLEYLSRHDLNDLLIKSIKSSDPIYNIGFLASEDWENACKQNSLLHNNYSFIYFDEYPIPLDPVFASKDKLNLKDREDLLELLSKWIYIPETSNKDDDWISDNYDFIKLTTSGKILDTSNTSKTLKKGDNLTISFSYNQKLIAIQDTLTQKTDSSFVLSLCKKEMRIPKEGDNMKYQYKFVSQDSLSYSFIGWFRDKKEKRNELIVQLNDSLKTNYEYVIFSNLKNEMLE